MSLRAARVTAAALLAGCTGVFVGPDAAPDQASVFEQIWRNLDRHYAFFVVKGVRWDSLHDAYAPQAAQAVNDAVLASTIGDLLAELRDLHVNLYAGGRDYRYTGYDSRPAFLDESVIRANYVNQRRTAANGRLQFGRIDSEIGYIRIPSFSGAGFGADLDAALAQLGPVRALIVDVRDNPGGSDQNARDVAGRFADQERTYSFVAFRDGPDHGDFTPPSAQRVSPAGASRFTGPVAVLTNRRCVSATEGFVLAMRAFPAVTVVGDSTAGGAGNPLTRELPNGWTYRFSQWIQHAPGQPTHEGVGLAPNVWVRGSAAELSAGRDAIIDTAIAVLGRTPATP